MTADTPTVTPEIVAGLREAAEKATPVDRWDDAFTVGERWADFQRLAKPPVIIALLDALRASEAERDTLARASKNDHDSYKALLAEGEAERERMRVALLAAGKLIDRIEHVFGWATCRNDLGERLKDAPEYVSAYLAVRAAISGDA